MDPTILASDFTERWERTTAVEALFDAIDRGDFEAAQSLGRDPLVRSALDAEEWTRLEAVACMATCGCPEIADEALAMIQREPRLVQARFGGKTLLHRAARSWSIYLAAPILELGADPNARDHAGHPPLYYAGNRFPLPVGIPDHLEHDLIALFLRYGADLDAAGGVKRCTPLHMAARRGHAGLAVALISHGASIEARDSNGETPLRRAVNCSQPAVVRVLLSAGANPKSLCNCGRTALDAARNEEMRCLLETH